MEKRPRLPKTDLNHFNYKYRDDRKTASCKNSRKAKIHTEGRKYVDYVH